MIHHVRGRRAFDSLRRSGRRVSAGTVWITFNADVTDQPRLAFAISRAVGTAVVRNRARRRLRVLFADLAASRPELVAPGDYLLGVRKADFTDEEANQWLTQALEKLRA